ncbi:hypothetical protein CERSUDRAFT_110297 [Gelatoporia subvermispora B]|uniref:Uncharacterized protein n=1 Tax=Ceriporiopsis subvermispora (strain B) TaxID=914234 RepID=M2PXT5_CERS8|nr:hypothetical protein CERSUDRAFT_110297 [Gelatoporia subvermispora B]
MPAQLAAYPDSRNPISYPTSNPPAQRAPLDDDDDDIKAPYDDLIDQYATQYKAFSVDAASFNTSQGRHGRAPSIPLTQKQSFSTDTHTTGKDPDGLDGQRLDWGYPPTPCKEEKKKRSLWHTIIPDSIACRLYLLIVLIETGIDLAIEGDLIVRVNAVAKDDGTIASQRMPVYLSIFALAHVFQFIMALDAVYARNTLQFIFLAVFNALFLVYAIIQISEIKELIPLNTPGFSDIPIKILTTIIPIVIAVAELAYIALGWKIYTEFGWKVYKFLGADRRIKTMYANYQIFLCLVKFDLFFWIGFSVQFIWLVLSAHNAEYYLTYAALPLSIVVLIEGHLAARHENKYMMITFMTGCAAAMVYFMYKLVKVLRLKDTDTFFEVWKTLTTFSVIAIILLIGTVIFAGLVMNAFGRGLKNQIAKNSTGNLQRSKTQIIHRGPMSTHPNRMSIE